MTSATIVKLIVEILMAIARHVLTGVGTLGTVRGIEDQDPTMIACGLGSGLVGMAWSAKRKLERTKPDEKA